MKFISKKLSLCQMMLLLFLQTYRQYAVATLVLSKGQAASVCLLNAACLCFAQDHSVATAYSLQVCKYWASNFRDLIMKCTPKNAVHCLATRDSWESKYGLLQFHDRLCCLDEFDKGFNAGISEIVLLKAEWEKIWT